MWDFALFFVALAINHGTLKYMEHVQMRLYDVRVYRDENRKDTDAYGRVTIGLFGAWFVGWFIAPNVAPDVPISFASVFLVALMLFVSIAFVVSARRLDEHAPARE